MPQKTMCLDKKTYFFYGAGNMCWTILVKKDSNSTLYVPVYRKGWQDGGEVEIFSQLPPAEAGDELLLHIRIYTKASDADRVAPLPNSPISIQSHLPVLPSLSLRNGVCAFNSCAF